MEMERGGGGRSYSLVEFLIPCHRTQPDNVWSVGLPKLPTNGGKMMWQTVDRHSQPRGEGGGGGGSWAKSRYRCANLSTNLDPSIYQENTKSDPSIYQFLWVYICLFNIYRGTKKIYRGTIIYSSNNTYLKQLPKFINLEYSEFDKTISTSLPLSLKTCLHMEHQMSSYKYPSMN